MEKTLETGVFSCLICFLRLSGEDYLCTKSTSQHSNEITHSFNPLSSLQIGGSDKINLMKSYEIDLFKKQI